MKQLEQGTKGEIIANVKKFIIDNFLFGSEPEVFTNDDSFLERGIIDSTGILELIGFIEQTFNIQINDDELLPENLDSLNCVFKFVSKKMHGVGGYYKELPEQS